MEISIKKEDLEAFNINNYVLHTPYFARYIPIKYYKKNKWGFITEPNYSKYHRDKFNAELKYINKCYYGIIEYLKDSFLLLSYIQNKYEKIKEDKNVIDADFIKLADYLDELLNRNIKSFIKGHYTIDKCYKGKYFHRQSNLRYHYTHSKYYNEKCAERFLKKYLYNNIYQTFNIFKIKIYNDIDDFKNIDYNKYITKIIAREEEFLKWY